MAQTKQQSPTLITELFDIVPENLPALCAYDVTVRGTNNLVRSGRKLADRLMRRFGGHWVWADDVIVTDAPQSTEALDQAIREIRIQEAETFKDLSGISLITDWNATARAQADFVAQGLFFDIGHEVQEALQPPVICFSLACIIQFLRIGILSKWAKVRKPNGSICKARLS